MPLFSGYVHAKYNINDTQTKFYIIDAFTANPGLSPR
jgi:hypothetical protein